MTHNLGNTSLRRKRRAADPMRSYDALPVPLRRWLADARLPWSPTSARRVWTHARERGLGPEEALSVLTKAEERTLARDRFAISNQLTPNT